MILIEIVNKEESKIVERHAFDLCFEKVNGWFILGGKLAKGSPPLFPSPRWNDAAQETNKREMAGGGLALK